VGFEDWRDFRVRLFLDEACARDFSGEALTEAAALAVAWAPLRCRLVGWNVRHVLETEVENPASAAEAVRGVVLGDNAQTIDTFWTQPQPDGSWVVRWRLETESISSDLSEVSTLALRAPGIKELDGVRRTMPAIARLEGVAYEGAWTLKAKA
jgi:hypothetical protein